MLSLSCDPKKHQEDKNITPSRKLAGPCETLFSEIPGFSSEMDHLSGRFQVMATSDNSPQKGNMPMKNSRLQEGNTSSNGGSPFAMLVFGVGGGVNTSNSALLVSWSFLDHRTSSSNEIWGMIQPPKEMHKHGIGHNPNIEWTYMNSLNKCNWNAV